MLISVLLAESTVGATTLTADRVVATLAALVALAGVIASRRRPFVALIAGVLGAVAGVLLLATADGGPGTGNGVVGAYAGVVLGLIAVVLGGTALIRTRRRLRQDI